MPGTSRARMLGKYFIVIDTFLVVVGFYMVFPIIGLHFVDQLGWAAAAVGMALGLRQVAQQGLGLIGGSLSDRFGAKPMIVWGMLLRAAGFAAMGYASSPALLFVSSVLTGLGGSMFSPARGALAIKLTRPYERAHFFSVLMTVESAASVAGALIGTLLLAFDFYWVAIGGCIAFVMAALMNAMVLPPYRVATPGSSALISMLTPLRDKPYMLFVLTLSGYYVLLVQIMLLLPVLVSQIAGSTRTVAWMYGMDTLLALLLLYPMKRFGTHYMSDKARLLLGIALMTGSLAAITIATDIVHLFLVIACFFTGSLIAEPAREVLVAQYASAKARASYVGLSRIGLAVGGLLGYVAGGYLFDAARALHLRSLPWMVLSVVGTTTLIALALQLYGASTLLLAVSTRLSRYLNRVMAE